MSGAFVLREGAAQTSLFPPAPRAPEPPRNEPPIPAISVTRSALDMLRVDRVPQGWSPDAPPSLDGIGEVALDTETTGLRWWAGDRPIGLSVSWDSGRESRYLPWGHAGGNLDAEVVRRWALAELRGKRIVGLNTRFDAHMLREWGVDLEALGCTLGDVGHYAALLDDHRRGFSLEAIAQDLLGEGKLGNLDPTRMADYHASQVTAYARRDAELVSRILAKQAPLLEAQDLRRVVALEDEVIFPVLAMEKRGARIDVEKLHRWRDESEKELTLLLMRVHQAAGFRVNPDRAEDLDRLFRERGLTSGAKTEKGRDSYTDEVMARAAAHDDVIKLVREAAHLTDLRAKYFVPYSNSVGADGILRFALNQLRGDEYGTVSGRFSSSQPVRGEGANIQQVMSIKKQIVRHGDRRIIRELFIPGSGLLFDADADQIEYRIFAHYSKSPRLIQAYRDNPKTDYHAIVGSMVETYRAGLDRTRIKGLNFGKLFGAGVGKISELLGVPEDQGREFVAAYDQAFPEASQLLHRVADLAKTRGYVKTALGRRARFPDGDRTYMALNRVIQGTAADVMKRKLVELHALRSEGFALRMTIHDEVVGDVPNLEVARRVAAVLDEQTTEMRVPLLWHAEVGPNWRDMKGLDE